MANRASAAGAVRIGFAQEKISKWELVRTIKMNKGIRPVVDWHRETVYGKPATGFASERRNGKTPRASSVLTLDHLRPAAIAAGVKLKKGQRFGFHNFRHGLASWRVNQGTDVKTVQGLVRHFNVSTTLGLYAHRVNSSMMGAQDSMMRALPPNQRPFNRV